MLQTTLSSPDFDPSLNRYFSDAVVSRYTRFFGLGTADTEFLWVVDEAIAAPLPLAWEEGVSRKKGGRLYYFRAPATQSTWVHPVDRFYQAYIARIREQLQSISASPAIRSFTARPPNICIDVLNLCAFLDIPPEADYVWVALVALSVPLPPSWIQREADLFENVETGEVMRSNPLDYIFYAWVQDAAAGVFGRAAGEWVLPRLNSREAAQVQPGKLLVYSFRQARAALVDAEALDTCGLQRMQPPAAFYAALERNPSLAWALPYALRAGEEVFCGGASASAPLLQKSVGPGSKQAQTLRMGDLSGDGDAGAPNPYTAAPAFRASFRQQGGRRASEAAQHGPGAQRECRATLSGRPESRHMYYKYRSWKLGFPDPYASPRASAESPSLGAPRADALGGAPDSSSQDRLSPQLLLAVPEREGADPDLVCPHDFLSLVGPPDAPGRSSNGAFSAEAGPGAVPGASAPGTPQLSASLGPRPTPAGRQAWRESGELTPTSYYPHQMGANRAGYASPAAGSGEVPEEQLVSPARRPRVSGGLQGGAGAPSEARTLVARKEGARVKPVPTPAFSVSGRRSQCASVSSLPYSPAPACNLPDSVERAAHAPQVSAYIQSLRADRLEAELRSEGNAGNEGGAAGAGPTPASIPVSPPALGPGGVPGSSMLSEGDGGFRDLSPDDLGPNREREPLPEDFQPAGASFGGPAEPGAGSRPVGRPFSASLGASRGASRGASPSCSPWGFSSGPVGLTSDPAQRRARSQRRASARFARSDFDGTPMSVSTRARARVEEAEHSYSPQHSLSPTTRRDREAEAALKRRLMRHRNITQAPQLRLPIAADYVLAQLLAAPPSISFFYASLYINPDTVRAHAGKDACMSFQVDPVNRIIYDLLPKDPMDRRFIALHLRCKIEYELAADAAARQAARSDPKQDARKDARRMSWSSASKTAGSPPGARVASPGDDLAPLGEVAGSAAGRPATAPLPASSAAPPSAPSAGPAGAATPAVTSAAARSPAEMYDRSHSHPLFRDVHPWAQPTVTYYINDKVVDAQPSCSFWGHFINTADFNVGLPLIVAEKYKFILKGCDTFTRQWYADSLLALHGVAQRVAAEIAKCFGTGAAALYTPDYSLEQLRGGEVSLRKLANSVLCLFSELQRMKPSMKLTAFAR